jgi:hypothetical protein
MNLKPLPSQRWLSALVVWLTSIAAFGQSTLDCTLCHKDTHAKWALSVHANTQIDVATELSQSHPGETPDAVTQDEDCIACHAPTAVLANNGMSEAQALGYFFTTTNGQFTATTQAAQASAWPHVACTACHDVPGNHPSGIPCLALFNSQTGLYVPVASVSELCGQCHGNLHFADTDHQIYNGWANSKHAHTQMDVADELGGSHPGETPAGVIQDENCIACHAPTAVLANGQMSESQALGYFFTTSAGQFTSITQSTNAAAWPGVSCDACHDPHSPGTPAFFNSSTKQYQPVASSAELCGQCHGNLRFPDTDHLSYNVVAGMGGSGVTNQVDMPAASCVDCHMFASDTDGTNSKMFGGHTWAVTVPESNRPSISSCTHCHATMDAAMAQATILAWQSDFQSLDAAVQTNLTRAAAALQEVQSSPFFGALDEAQHNISYAESDESGGFHNHKFLMDLLNDANAKARSIPILNAVQQGSKVLIWWTGTGTLQSAPALSGPWSDVQNATNPLTIPSTGPTQFYHLRP